MNVPAWFGYTFVYVPITPAWCEAARDAGKGAEMKRTRAASQANTLLLWSAMAVLALAIFAADTATDREIAFSVLYVVVVLLSVWSGRPGVVAAVGAGCAVLMVASFVLSPTGSLRVGLINCVLSLIASGATTYLAIKIEAADRAVLQAQADLAHMSRVSTMGELTSSIAHEVSQPLAAIVSNGNAAIRWLAATPPNEAEVRAALDRIVEAADRAGAVVNRVRGLAKRAPPSRQPVDIAAMIYETLAVARGEIRGSQIQLRTEVASTLPAVIGDRIQLQQVVLNLVINAIEAMAGTDAAHRDLLVSAATDGPTVTVAVRDSGQGLPAAPTDQIFEAFCTTKPDGLGVGLAISKSIIEAHGGSIYAARNYPRGAVFGFTLPAAAPAQR